MDLFKPLSLKNTSLNDISLPIFLLPYLVVMIIVTSTFQLRTHSSPAHYSLRSIALQCDLMNKKFSVRNSLQNAAKGETWLKDVMSDLDSQAARGGENDWQLWHSKRYVFCLQGHNPALWLRMNQKCYTDLISNFLDFLMQMLLVCEEPWRLLHGKPYHLGETVLPSWERRNQVKRVLNDFLIRKMVPM